MALILVKRTVVAAAFLAATSCNDTRPDEDAASRVDPSGEITRADFGDENIGEPTEGLPWPNDRPTHSVDDDIALIPEGATEGQRPLCFRSDEHALMMGVGSDESGLFAMNRYGVYYHDGFGWSFHSRNEQNPTVETQRLVVTATDFHLGAERCERNDTRVCDWDTDPGTNIGSPFLGTNDQPVAHSGGGMAYLDTEQPNAQWRVVSGPPLPLDHRLEWATGLQTFIVRAHGSDEVQARTLDEDWVRLDVPNGTKSVASFDDTFVALGPTPNQIMRSEGDGWVTSELATTHPCPSRHATPIASVDESAFYIVRDFDVHRIDADGEHLLFTLPVANDVDCDDVTRLATASPTHDGRGLLALTRPSNNTPDNICSSYILYWNGTELRRI